MLLYFRGLSPWHFFIGLFILLSMVWEITACPRGCMCADHVTRCAMRNMTRIPSRIPRSTKVIDLRMNKITHLHRHSFRQLQHVHTILLNDNHITIIDPTAFKYMSKLKNLYLYDNRLTNVQYEQFRGLNNLQTLYLHNNRISRIESTAFDDMSSLKHLYLSGNQLRYLPSDSLHHLDELIRIRLDDNPFNCNCSLKSLGNLLRSRNIEESRKAVCESPPGLQNRPLSGINWESVCTSSRDLSHVQIQANPPHNDLTLPTITNGPTDTVGVLGDTIVLDCSANGNPHPLIEWLRNDRAIRPTSDVDLLSNGQLIIRDLQNSHAGDYTCRARNRIGQVTARARLTIRSGIVQQSGAGASRPVFVIKPVDVLIPEGGTAKLICQAEGNPEPRISWRHSSKVIDTSRRQTLARRDSELTIFPLLTQDVGNWTCTATNIHASITTNFVIRSRRRTSPKFTQVPEDKKVEAGSGVEFVCRAKGEPRPRIAWYFNGSPLPTVRGHYNVDSVGTLTIDRVTQDDHGSYSCQAVNTVGSVATDNKLTVYSNPNSVNTVIITDELITRTVQEATDDIDRAINQTRTQLFDPTRVKTPHELLALFRFPKPQAVELARAREIYERSLELINGFINEGLRVNSSSSPSSSHHFESLLSVSHLQMLMEMTGCTPGQFKNPCDDMCFNSRYRSYDGQCNNLQNPMWGVSLMPFYRLLPPIYENGFNQPVGWDPDRLYSGYLKPNPRDVSLQVIATGSVTPDPKYTAMLMQWGQFIDHDLDFAVGATSRDIFATGSPCHDTCDYDAPCFNIPLPSADPRRHPAAFCMEFERSSAVCGSGQTSLIFERVTPREQLSQITSYLDASQVYGSSEQETLDLRDLFSDHGLLRFDIVSHTQKPYLPFNRDAPMDCRRNGTHDHSIRCFLAGDYRANEQLALLSMHTLFLREHNRIASQLLVLNPHWDGEKIFHETRKIIGAIMQHITYAHWLPHILGDEGMQLVGEYKGYNAGVNPTVSNVFATAAFRFGHGLVNPTLYRFGSDFEPIQAGHLPLHQAFFAPERLLSEGGIDPLLRGLFAGAMKSPRSDQVVNRELTEHLFDKAHNIALDLAALNIQRGRDHAIPAYVDWRKYCNLTVQSQWSHFEYDVPDFAIREKLSKLYGHPGNMDLWVGGMLEKPLPGSRVGPTFACIIADQFKRTRDGDRFWYESPGAFTPLQLAEIKRVALSSILCNSGDEIDRVQQDAFVYPGSRNPALYSNCSTVPQLNLNIWQACCEDSCSATQNQFGDSDYEDEVTSKRKRRSTDGQNIDEVSNLEEMVQNMKKQLDKLETLMVKDGTQCKDGNHWYKNGHGWTIDHCTKCQCKEGQIWCSTKSCPELECKHTTTLPFTCCAVCVNKY